MTEPHRTSPVRRRRAAAGVVLALTLLPAAGAVPGLGTQHAYAGTLTPQPTPAPTGTSAPAASPTPDRLTLGGPELDASGTVVHPADGVPALPVIDPASWLVADLDTGDVLAASNAHAQLAPASTLKTLTAITLLPRLDKAATYTATDADARVEGSRVGLVPGAQYTVQQLWEALFLRSGNDAAHALAELGGGQQATVVAMAAQAKALGALDTVPKGPSGLDEPGQVSSAYDLALIARQGLSREDFRTYAGTRTSTFPGRDGTTFAIDNENRMLGRYPGALGVKTGFTTQAGRTFVGAAEHDGHTLVVTLMHTKAASADVAAALLDWGFAARGKVRPVGRLLTPAEAAAAVVASLSATPRPTSTPPAAVAPGARGAVAAGPAPVAQQVGASLLGVWTWPALALLSVLVAGVGAALNRRGRRPRAERYG